MKLEFAARARSEIERSARWWIANRPAAPLLLAQELEDLFVLLNSPIVFGTIYASKRGRTIRRVLLPKTGYHVYFRYDAPDLIRVLSIWGAKRERAPSL